MPINLIEQEQITDQKVNVFLSPIFAFGLVSVSLAIMIGIIYGLESYINKNSEQAKTMADEYTVKTQKLLGFEQLINKVNAKAAATNTALSEHVKLTQLLTMLADVTPKNDVILKNIAVDDKTKTLTLTGQTAVLDINDARSYAFYISEYPNKDPNAAQKEPLVFSNVSLKSFQMDAVNKKVDFVITANYDKKVYQYE